jgi:hypothetical protein
MFTNPETNNISSQQKTHDLLYYHEQPKQLLADKGKTFTDDTPPLHTVKESLEMVMVDG